MMGVACTWTGIKIRMHISQAADDDGCQQLGPVTAGLVWI
jgi:hypothetical protein